MRSINGAISNDLERTLILFQGQAILWHYKYITTYTDTAIVTIEVE